MTVEMECEIFDPDDNVVGWVDIHEDNTVDWELERDSDAFPFFNETMYAINNGSADLPTKWNPVASENEDGEDEAVGYREEVTPYQIYKYIRANLYVDGFSFKWKEELSRIERKKQRDR